MGAWVSAWCVGHGKLTKDTTPKEEQLVKCPFLKAEIVLPGTQPGGQNKD